MTWLHEEVEIGDGGGRYTSQHEGNFFCLDVSPVVAEDGGMWACRAVTEAGGEAECSCYLNVLGKDLVIIRDNLKCLLKNIPCCSS